MRRILLAALLLFSIAHCAQYPAGMGELGAYMVSPGTAFSIDEFSFRNSSAYAIVSGGEPYAILVPNFPFFMPKALTDNKTLEEALFAYELSRGYDPNSTQIFFFLVHRGLDEVEDDKDKGEAECRRLAGTDRFECSSFESCRLACFATPFCPNFAYGGDPGEFIYTIWEYENDSRALDSAYDAEERAYAAFGQDPSDENALAYLDSLSGLNRAATQVASTKLYRYSFCFTPDYALPPITSLQLQAQMHHKNASHFSNLPSLAAKVQNRTMEGLLKKKRFELPSIPAILSWMNSSSRFNISNAANKLESKAEEKKFDLNGILAPVAIALCVLLVMVATTYFAIKHKRRQKEPPGK